MVSFNLFILDLYVEDRGDYPGGHPYHSRATRRKWVGSSLLSCNKLVLFIFIGVGFDVRLAAAVLVKQDCVNWLFHILMILYILNVDLSSGWNYVVLSKKYILNLT